MPEDRRLDPENGRSAGKAYRKLLRALEEAVPGNIGKEDEHH
jgi:hypothetical protein